MSAGDASIRPPLLTETLPGIGGRIKAHDEHFVVREQPLYEPSGDGEHLYLTIRRAGRNTADIARDIARLLDLQNSAVGYAGRKDRHALVTQTFSIYLPGDSREPDRIAGLVQEKLALEVIAAARHENKLRTGHLAGNEFEILVSAIEIDGATARARAEAIIACLRLHGLPNFFGEQRFGRERENILRGRQVLKGRTRPRRPLADLFISAYQSHLFNLWLGARMERGDFERLLAGDVARRVESGGLFEVEDAANEQTRFDAGEIDYTGPLFGRKMKAATDRAGQFETELLQTVGMKEKDFRLATGARRPGRLPCPEIEIREAVAGLWFRFSLPKGAFATTLLREIMKSADLEQSSVTEEAIQ